MATMTSKLPTSERPLILDRDLALVWPGRIAVRAVEALRARGYHVLFQPDINEALDGMAMNFVTIGPRAVVMAAGNPVSQAYYEAHGVRCVTVPVDELAKAAGAAGCLTGIVRRAVIS